MSFTPPTVADFKAQFVRDFPYAPELDPNNKDYVTDADIQSALNNAGINFNDGLFGNSTNIIYLYAAAHYLSVNLQNSMKGVASQAKFALLSTGVGSVNISNNINDRFANDPIFSSFLRTGYGQMYLDFVYPYTVGNVQTDCGRTTFA